MSECESEAVGNCGEGGNKVYDTQRGIDNCGAEQIENYGYNSCKEKLKQKRKGLIVEGNCERRVRKDYDGNSDR